MKYIVIALFIITFSTFVFGQNSMKSRRSKTVENNIDEKILLLKFTPVEN